MTTLVSSRDQTSSNNFLPIPPSPTSLHDLRLAEEASGKLWSNIPNLIETAFPNPNSSVVDKVKAQLYSPSTGQWTTFPKSTTEREVAGWLLTLEEAFGTARGIPTASRMVWDGDGEGDGTIGGGRRRPSLVFVNRNPDFPFECGPAGKHRMCGSGTGGSASETYPSENVSIHSSPTASSSTTTSPTDTGTPPTDTSPTDTSPTETSPTDTLPKSAPPTAAPPTCPQPNVSWHHIRFFGELKLSDHQLKNQRLTQRAFITIISRAWELFASQPTRWLVRCFALAGSSLQCFLIDRSGGFASIPINIHQHPDLTLRVFYYFFCTQDVGDLGFDNTFFVHDNYRPRVPLSEPLESDPASPASEPVKHDPTSPPSEPLKHYDPTFYHSDPLKQRVFIKTKSYKEPLYIDLSDPLCFRTSLFSRGTRLWPAGLDPDGPAGFDMVIKDAWLYSDRVCEGEIFAQIEDHPNLPGYLEHCDLDVGTSVVKYSLQLQRAHQYSFPEYDPWLLDFPCSHQSSSSLTETPAPTKTTSSRNTRKRSAGSLASPDPKRPKVTASNTASLANTTLKRHHPRTPIRLIFKRRGHPLSTYRNAYTLLSTLHSCLLAHTHIYTSGFLHRDISPFNLLLLPHTTPPTGLLIDLDHAIPLTPSTASPPSPAGTPLFMALSLLSPTPQPPSRLHDLHSFLYLLLWMLSLGPCTCPPSSTHRCTCLPAREKSHPLSPWTRDRDYKNIFKTKLALTSTPSDWCTARDEILARWGDVRERAVLATVLDRTMMAAFRRRNVEAEIDGVKVGGVEFDYREEGEGGWGRVVEVVGEGVARLGVKGG